MHASTEFRSYVRILLRHGYIRQQPCLASTRPDRDFAFALATNTEDIRYAAELPRADFENAMQVATARACGARHIVTRNVSAYERSPIRAVSPKEARDELF